MKTRARSTLAGVAPALAIASALAFSAGCGSCSKDQGAGGEDAAAPVASNDGDARPRVMASALRSRGAPHSAAAGALFRSARALPDLRPEQKAKVDAAEAGAREPDPTRAEAHALHNELSSELKSGAVDAPKLDGMLAAIERSAQAHEAEEAKSVDGLWAALDPAQRKTVSAEIRKRQGPRLGGAHADASAGARRPEVAARRLARLTRELDLDADQQKKIDAILAKEDKASPDPRAETKRRFEDLLDAFERDGFEASKLEIFSAAGKTARAPHQRDVDLVTQILPILKPEQRDKLATKMDVGSVRRFGRLGRGLARPAAVFDDPSDEMAR
jgi:hypothetical protein